MKNTPRRLGLALVVVLGLALTMVVTTPAPASAADRTMTFDGRGWGHGRGMSQYGAQGYATKFGWTNNQILDHYYGGTRFGTVSQAAAQSIDPNYVRSRIIAMDGQNVIVMGIGAGSTFSVNGATATIPPTDKSIQLRRSGSQWEVWSGATCNGSYTRRDTASSGTVTVGRSSGADQLYLCRPDGTKVFYPGSLRGWTDGSNARTVTITTAEEYLRGVVPNESPASWDQDALMAQAVAARSYLLAGDTRHQPYADTCDTTLCQVYKGHFEQKPGGSKQATTHPNTDLAIQNTKNEIRLTSSNRIARTEFSSTSGGWTAGGTFPAVEDKGDVVSPLHTWTRTVSVEPLERAYGSGGQLKSMEVTKRNGLGADGGRVLEVRLAFTNGVSRTVSGNAVRASLGLLSDWFTPRCGSEAVYIDAAYELFLRRGATPTDIDRWCGTVRVGGRDQLTSALSVSDEWAGVQINGLYRKILGRDADASGRSYWLGRVRDGLRIEDIAAYFYGGDEYFGRAGSTNRGYVDRLYRDLLGRNADAPGRDYWVSRLDRGALGRDAVAANFYASVESRTSRVDSLYRQILGRPADTGGRSYWVDQLATLGDVKLAAYLAASSEFYLRATR